MDQKEMTYYVLCQPSYNNCAAVVSYMAGYFKSECLYFEDSKDLCRADIVFFQNSNGLSHVGLCIDWDSNGFTTIEGNKDNAVKECYYYYTDVGDYVAGFAHPRYTDFITEQAVIAYAKSQIGYEESGDNWNKYAEQLDAIDYFAGCGDKQNLPWCCVFICACFYNAYKEPNNDSGDEDIDGLIASLKDVSEKLEQAFTLFKECQDDLNAIIKELNEEG